MRYGRILVLLMVMAGAGAYWGLAAQERRVPFPPKPIVPPEPEEQGEPRKRPTPPADIPFPAPPPPPGALPPVPVMKTEPPKLLPKTPPKSAAKEMPVKDTPVKDTLIIGPPATKPIEIGPTPIDILPPPVFEEKKGPPKTLDRGGFPPPPLIVDSHSIKPDAAKPLPLSGDGMKPPPSSAEGVSHFRLLKPIVRPELSTVPFPASDERSLVSSAVVGRVPAGSIVVEKRGPHSVARMGPVTFDIVVRNQGEQTANNLHVEDELPVGARLEQSEPEAAILGHRLLWIVPTLAAGEEKVMRITVSPFGPGEMKGATRVYVPVAASSFRLLIPAAPGAGAVVAPTAVAPVAVEIKTPAAVATGSAFSIDIVLRNTARQPSGKLVLMAKLSEGLSHPEGRSIEAEMNGLAVAGEDTVRLKINAASPGLQTLDVVVESADGQRSTAHATVLVGEAGLKISHPATTQLWANGGEQDIVLEVSNVQPFGARNVHVVDRLPDGVGYFTASDGGLFRSETKAVSWMIPYLAPGEVKTLRLRVIGQRVGTFMNQVSIRSDASPESRTSGAIQVLPPRR